MLIIAEHPQFGKVRTIENEGKMWFCAADVAQALGYVNTNDAIARHCKTKGVVASFYDIPTAGGRQRVKFIDEGNLYRLIAGSREVRELDLRRAGSAHAQRGRLSAGEKGGNGRRTAFTCPDAGGKQAEGA